MRKTYNIDAYIPNYPDEGCGIAPCCLKCKEPKCFEDMTIKEKKYALSGRAKRQRDEEIRRLRGKTKPELMRMLKVSTSTIKRALKREV